MIGLVVVAVFTVYLAVSIFVVRLVARRAKAKGRSAKRWGIAAALFMYLLVFWDHIPTLVLHHYYCATKAGFWVYKTPEQWKAENPGVAETLTWKSNSSSYEAPGVTQGYRLNERFVWVQRVEKAIILPVRLTHEEIIDLKTDETVVKRINVGSGYGSFALGGEDWRVLKGWVRANPCYPNQAELNKLLHGFLELGREIK